MLLNKIKLAGFKSFVDPTTINFPGKLIAVVGPNGSGKSNIIDAMCCVMGESSMKYLRGEALTDVIFNGSSARKPVGQASVELIFDNQDGTISGEYGKYSEIAIKRLITRDGDSTYYLNGSPCRRRDILDIFSGTGLGPRSYSIIGQNMVSRLVEAKPDDMRVYLEEAAGISKYKDRRRETELRIQHTKENLSRVNDLRSELDRQLNTLKRQANDAERYKTLREQERIVKAQWHSIQWRQLDGQLQQYSLQIQQEETAQEGANASLVETETAVEQRRQEQRAASDTFQEVQRRYYAVGNEITRMEQDLLHQEERHQQWEADVRQVEKDWQEAGDQVAEMQDELKELSSDVEALEPQWQEALERAKEAAQKLRQVENESQSWQTRWDAFHQQVMKVGQEVEVGQTRLAHLQQKLASVKQQQSKIQQEESQIDFARLENEIAGFSSQLLEVEAQVKQDEQALQTLRGEMSRVQRQQQESTHDLDKLRSELQKTRGKKASVEALQEAALGQRDQPIVNWLARHQLDKQARLAQGIEVESGWEAAVEKALGPYLQAICIDKIAGLCDKIEDLSEGQLFAFATELAGSSSSSALYDKGVTLLSKIKSKLPIAALLAGVYVADNVNAALQLLGQLSSSESVITPEGLWLSPTWLRLSNDKNPTAGIFQREQELKQFQETIAALEGSQEKLEASLREQQEQIKELETKRDQLQQVLGQDRAKLADLATQAKAKNERLIELQRKSASLAKDRQEYQRQEQQTEAELAQVNEKLQTSRALKEQLATQQQTLVQERDQARILLQESRLRADGSKEESHQLEIRLQSSKSQQGTLQHALERRQAQLTTLTERKETLQAEAAHLIPLEGLKTTLAQTLDKRVALEAELNQARAAMEALEQTLAQLDKQRHQVEETINALRDRLESLRLESQSLRLKSEGLQEQVKEGGFELEAVLQELAPEASAEEKQNEFERLTQKIARLGSINLIAVDEYASCLERKQYLDKQYEDLQSSLNTLENAIEKIDRETRTRFKETYEKINQRFQELFPLVFGGGQASLELVGDNLLEAGVAVMACPPGKRNSSIHLLSGGEKSMTALALIFSIFHLNPAPLCLLDEVDAALDDMNVSRFCELVKHMSERTQFIFISHNKLAIEMAEHLIGITMHEPGVSRLVSVSVQEAVSMAAAG